MIVAAAAYVVSIEFEIVSFSSKASITTSAFVVNVTFVVIDPLLKTQLFNDITVYGSSEIAARLTVVAKEFLTIWNDQGITVDISKNQWMLIDLKSDVSIKSAKIYSVGFKKRKVIDNIFDKMHVDGKMIWSAQSTVFSFSVFVVWRDTLNGLKNKVVVDIKGLNKVTEVDIYPMSLQTNIISAVADYSYIFIVDAVD